MIQAIDFEELMVAAQKWVVCEESGRWVAALRVAFGRLAGVQPTPRLHEVRTLGELSTHLDEHRCDLTLIEVGRSNLTDVLQLLTRCGPHLRFVALLGDAVPAVAIPSEPGTLPVVDLLWEVGAAEVVETPRQLSGLLALHRRLAAARSPINVGLAERQLFADWAWSTLPWQDA